MKTTCVALGLLVFAACAGNRELPDPGAGRPGPLSAGGVTPPVYALLGHRDRLELSSTQVNALDSIAAWLEQANKPVLAELGEGREDDGSRRRRAVRSDSAATQLLVRLAVNNEAAVSGVRALLSPEQQRRVCEIFPPAGGRRGDADRRPPPPERRQGASTPLGGAANRPRGPAPGWSWCHEPPPTTGQAKA